MPEPLPRPHSSGTRPSHRVEPVNFGLRTSAPDRRHARRDVEMLARFRRGVTSMTVMLKDLTPLGARVEGVGLLEEDEIVTLALPGCRPTLAFVAWANAHCAGLEFVEALEDALFDGLVAQYGLAAEDTPLRTIP